MASFGVEIEEKKEVIDFVIATNKRLQDGRILNNPFHGRILNLGDALAVSMRPIYFNIPLVAAFFIGIPCSVFWGFRPFWMIPVAFFLCASLLWSRFFFFAFMFLGLRKAGYKGKYKLLSNPETIRRLIYNGTKRSPGLAGE